MKQAIANIRLTQVIALFFLITMGSFKTEHTTGFCTKALISQEAVELENMIEPDDLPYLPLANMVIY